MKQGYRVEKYQLIGQQDACARNTAERTEKRGGRRGDWNSSKGKDAVLPLTDFTKLLLPLEQVAGENVHHLDAAQVFEVFFLRVTVLHGHGRWR